MKSYEQNSSFSQKMLPIKYFKYIISLDFYSRMDVGFELKSLAIDIYGSYQFNLLQKIKSKVTKSKDVKSKAIKE